MMTVLLSYHDLMAQVTAICDAGTKIPFPILLTSKI